MLKKQKNKLCVVNLVLFLVSFGLLSFSSYSNENNNTFSDHQHQFVSSAHHNVDNTIQLSEENKVESDNDLEVQALELPFLASNAQSELFHQPFSLRRNRAEKARNLIYKRVCNFRV